MAKQTPNYISDDNATQAKPMVKKLISSLSFFHQRLENNPTETDVFVHIGILESISADLYKLFGYKSKTNEKQEQMLATIRNERQQLEKEKQNLSSATSATQVTTCLRQYENIFCAWYESIGFHYASIESINVHGFFFDLSDELNKEQHSHLSSDKYFFDWCCQKFQPIQQEDGVDFYEDAYHDNLLDTDKNKQILYRLLRTFPSAYIKHFHTMFDENMHKLRWTVYVPFQDLENLYRTYQSEQKES